MVSKNNYRRNIRLLKGLIALIGISVLFMIFMLPMYKNLNVASYDKIYSLSKEELKLKKGSSQTMVENLKFYGSDIDNKPYSIFAASGHEKEGGAYLLKQIQSDFLLNDAILSLQADFAEMHKAESMVILEGNVTFISDNGYSLQSEKATLNIKTKAAQGSQNVVLKGEIGEVKADSFMVNDGATEVTFNGDSRVKTKLIK